MGDAKGQPTWSRVSSISEHLQGRLPGALTLYGPVDSERAIGAVVVVDDLGELDVLAPSTVVTLATHLCRTAWSVEYAIRKCWERAAACVIACRGGGLPGSIGTLADRLQIPVLITDSATVEVATAIAVAIELPQMRRVELLARVAERFAFEEVSPKIVGEVIREALPGVRVEIKAAGHEPGAAGEDDPVSVRRLVMLDDDHDRPTLRLSLDVSEVDPSLRDLADRIARLAAAPLALWGLRLRTRLDREEAYSGAVLRRLVEDPAGVESASLRAALGWPSDGRHAVMAWGVEATLEGATAVVIGHLIEEQARAVAGTKPVRSGRYWFVALPASDDEQSVPALADRLSRSVDAAVSSLASVACGVSEVRTPGELAMSIQESEMACRVSSGVGGVVHAGHITPADLLAAASTTTLLEPARALLAKVVAADETGTLLRTLAAYLDHNGSATSTASALGVHRNTVAARIERISGLGYDLSLPRERMGLFLAARVLLGQTEEHPGFAEAGRS